MGILQMVMSAVSAALGYNPKRSTRFNYADSPYLIRDVPLGNQQVFTFSAWVKFSCKEDAADHPYLFCTDYNVTSTGNNVVDRGFELLKHKSNHTLNISDYGASDGAGNSGSSSPFSGGNTTAIFRDPSAWYHIVMAVDTTQSTGSDRIKLYVNNEIHALSAYPAQNLYLSINQARNHYIGGQNLAGALTRFVDGHLADVNFVDGLALDATSFGETNILTGQWIPKEYTHAASPNNGTTWSNSLSGARTDGTNEKDDAFDGSLSTKAGTSTVGGTLTFTPSSAIAYSSSVKVYTYWGSASNVDVSLNGGSTVTDPGNQWTTIATGSGSITSMTFTGTTNSGEVSAIEVDGKVLLDGAGDNSFHLAMDPAESGEIYSGNIEISSSASGATLGQAASKGFNGTVSDWYEVSVSTGGQAIVNYNGTLTGVTTLEFYGGTSASGSDTITVTGTGVSSTVITSMGSTKQSITVTNSTVSNLTFTVSGANNFRLAGLYVNGKLLVDHTAIGYDISGQNNHWHENNLADNVTVYSDTVSGGTGTYSDAFDGQLASVIYPRNQDAEGNLVFAGGLSCEEVYCNTYSSSGTEFLTDSASSPTAVDTSNSFAWVSLPADATVLNEIKGTGGPGYNAFAIAAFKKDGNILIDGVPADLDLLADVPGAPYDNSLNGGGNYCTLNPLHRNSDWTLSNGNLTGHYDPSDSTYPPVAGTIAVSSGKWYWEVEYTSSSGSQGWGVGVCNSSMDLDGSDPYKSGFWGTVGRSASWANYVIDGAYTAFTTPTVAQGDILGVKLDLDNNTLYITKNGIALLTVTTALPADTYFPVIMHGSAPATGDFNVNFGQRPFDNLPTGYKALNVFNLPEPTIVDPSKQFEAKTYSGTGLTNPQTGLEFEPGLTWIKRRNQSTAHFITDAVRGAGLQLDSASTDDEDSQTSRFVSFDSGGFTVGSTHETTNESGGTYVAWNWDAGTANTVVEYDNSDTWSDDVTNVDSSYPATRAFDGSTETTCYATAGTTAVFTPASTISGDVYVMAYAYQAGGTHSKFKVNGTDYTSSIGSTYHQWVKIPETSLTNLSFGGDDGTHYVGILAVKVGNKLLLDSGASTASLPSVYAGDLNSTAYDQSQTWSNSTTSSDGWYNSNYAADKGFNGITSGNHAATNSNGTITFAPNLTIPANSVIEIYSGSSSTAYMDVTVNGVANNSTAGGAFVQINYDNSTTLTSLTITRTGGGNSADLRGLKINGKLLVDSGVTPAVNVPTIPSTYRANPTAGFSIGTYTGTYSSPITSLDTVAHNLNAVPGFIVTKSTNNAEHWHVWHSALDNDKYLRLNVTNSVATLSSGAGGSIATAPTSTVFPTYFLSGSNNGSGSDYVFYAWSEVAGYSKFGSYEGNGSADGPFVYTGMRTRWLMVKSSSNSGENWLILDTERDPHNLSDATIYANLANSEYESSVLGIDILSNGFKLIGTNAGTNASGYTYIFAAFAESPFKYSNAR